MATGKAGWGAYFASYVKKKEAPNSNEPLPASILNNETPKKVRMIFRFHYNLRES
jgi:hypothetical protein